MRKAYKKYSSLKIKFRFFMTYISPEYKASLCTQMHNINTFILYLIAKFLFRNEIGRCRHGQEHIFY